ncbi:hypothetical protein E2C01_016460 [Portunus trituberculatus]|uniref:Uncharacterized protein n=1 Tax=Portunus trituberculatus TaxID=210409 RepID=A0A5B7DQT2_PORTR|nr:hypothetical protein [Portunus trituberculatus]
MSSEYFPSISWCSKGKGWLYGAPLASTALKKAFPSPTSETAHVFATNTCGQQVVGSSSEVDVKACIPSTTITTTTTASATTATKMY